MSEISPFLRELVLDLGATFPGIVVEDARKNGDSYKIISSKGGATSTGIPFGERKLFGVRVDDGSPILDVYFLDGQAARDVRPRVERYAKENGLEVDARPSTELF